MGLFDELELLDQDEVKIMRAPFGYIGSKRTSLKYILPQLPYANSYIEVFGGSGVVLLNRRPSKLDVYNDRFGGVVCFYRCLRDRLDELCDRLSCTCFSKEEYYWCRDTWPECQDEVERAARWYYSMATSFGNKGTQWGRKTNSGMTGIHNKIKGFQPVHERLKSVQIENASWQKILKDYDSPEAVFYLDPPYVGTDNGGYKYDMSHSEHSLMLDTIHSMEGFVALSGFSNSLYEGHPWDDRITWEVTCTLDGNAGEGNRKNNDLTSYGKTEEVLWIKEAT